MADVIPKLKIFISSPGDVREQRDIAEQVLTDLLNTRTYRDSVSFQIIRWDKPQLGTRMRARRAPQDAINDGVPRPRSCDLVVVMLWSRLGSPCVVDKTPYKSGTHFELIDALAGDSDVTELLIYRRKQAPDFPQDESGDPQREQLRALNAFLKSDDVVDPISGQRLTLIEHQTAEDFRLQFREDAEEWLLDWMERWRTGKVTQRPNEPSKDSSDGGIRDIQPEIWHGSPFPGLRAFEPKDAPIFFGRGAETDTLILKVRDSRFVAVFAESGSGKSSLVGAGLIPRLASGALPHSEDWLIVPFKPGLAHDPLEDRPTQDPFEALYFVLIKAIPSIKPSGFRLETDREAFCAGMRTSTKPVLYCIDDALRDQPDHAEILLWIDQFEEVFTQSMPDTVAPFIEMLDTLSRQPRTRVVVTLRSDFYERCGQEKKLGALLNQGMFTLTTPSTRALREMIEKPAERALLNFADGLSDTIVEDVGREPGGLALMAYLLDELYQRGKMAQAVTLNDYTALGGVSGAIATRAEEVFLKLPGKPDDNQRLLEQVFRRLVEVEPNGAAVRRRAFLTDFTPDESVLVSAFAAARLLTTGNDLSKAAVVDVAHEALLREWPRLKRWIEASQEDFILLRQMRNAAHEWQTKKDREPDKNFDYLRWPQERLVLVYEMMERLQPKLNDVERDFIEPEQARLLREIEKNDTNHERRRDIGDRLAVIGDTRVGVGVKDGLPDILWLPVDGSDKPTIIKTDKNVIGPVMIPPFFAAKYLITYLQFDAFLKAPDGFENEAWWAGMPKDYIRQSVKQQRTKTANSPRDSVSWYQAVAFTRWLNHRSQGLTQTLPSGLILRVGENAEIRLPTEWEWQWMAQGGNERREYPWGAWQEGYANTSEAGLNRTTAVGMYPHGAAQAGAEDAAGNLWEWCLSDYEKPGTIDGYGNRQSKVRRGGSFDYDRSLAAASYRSGDNPNSGYDLIGFRVVLSAPIASLASGSLISESE